MQGSFQSGLPTGWMPRGALARLVRIACWIALLCTALSFAGCKASMVPARQGLLMRNVEFPMRQLVFPSGLRVIAERDPRAKVVGLFLVVGAGSSADPVGKEGLAHYVEHLAFRSRPYRKSSFRRLLERAGAGEWNARTTLDATVYYEVGPTSELPELLRLEAARMLAPVANLTPEVMAVELDVVRSELRQHNETGFAGEVIGSLQKAVFPAGHPYARPVIGTHETLTSIDEADIQRFLQLHYQPNNMTLVVIGDIDLNTIEGTIRQALPAELGRARPHSAPRPALPKRAPEPPTPPGQLLSRGQASVTTPEIWIGWSLPRAFDAEAYVVQMAAQMAGGRLLGAAGTDIDITNVETGLMPGKDASMLVCRVVLERGIHPERSLERVLNEMGGVWSPSSSIGASILGGVMFGSRQRSAVVQMLLETENLRERGVARGLTTHFTRDPLMYTRRLESVIQLKQEPLLDFAEKYLGRERARAVLFTPAPGGALASARPIGAQQLGEEDPLPLRIDEDRLRSMVPSQGIGQYRRFALPNGLDVVIGRREGSPSASVAFMAHGGKGAAADAAAVQVASMLTRSSRWSVQGGPFQFGGHWRQILGADKTLYMLDGAAGNVAKMVAIMAETIPSLDIDADSFRSMDRYRLSYLKRIEQKPEAAADRAFHASLFAGHAYGRSVTADDIHKTSAGAAQEWLDATQVANNGVLVVVGELDVDEIDTLVRHEFGDWKANRDLPPSVPATYERPMLTSTPGAAPISLVVTERPGATQAQIRLGCVLPPVHNAIEDAEHDVAAQLAEDRIGETLRERNGITYGVRSSAHVLRGGTAYLEIQGAVERGKLGGALKTIREVLQSLGDVGSSENELAWAKLRVARARTTSHLTNHNVALAIMNAMNLGFEVPSLDLGAAQIHAASATGAQRSIRACMAGGATLSLIGEDLAIDAALKEAGLRAASPGAGKGR